MSNLTFNSNSIGASAPSAGLWRRAADLYWTGWTQYAASMNNDVSLRLAFPLYRNQGQGARSDASLRLIDRAA